MSKTVRFECYEVDLAGGQIYKRGARLRLPDQAFLGLASLLEHAGQAVSREELRRRFWPDQVFVDFGNVLNSIVWPEIERELSSALQLNPASSLVRVQYAVGWLMPQGRIEDAIEQLECALEWDPLSYFVHHWLTVMLALARDWDRVVDQARLLMDLFIRAIEAVRGQQIRPGRVDDTGGPARCAAPLRQLKTVRPACSASRSRNMSCVGQDRAVSAAAQTMSASTVDDIRPLRRSMRCSRAARTCRSYPGGPR